MNLYKQQNKFGTDIILKDDNKSLAFRFCGNGDLYWVINSQEQPIVHKLNFVITKENYELYKLFEQLFIDIKNSSVFDSFEMMPFYIQNSNYNCNTRDNEKNKLRKLMLDFMKYKELYNLEENTITWHSDETAYEVSNVLKIIKEKDKFNLEFSIQKHRDEYDKDFNSPGYIQIRFRNSGSFYTPFNVIFMRMYHNMSFLDDVNEEGHQIHLEEYLYIINR